MEQFFIKKLWEVHGRQNPTLLTLKKLADAIGVTVNQLLGLEEE